MRELVGRPSYLGACKRKVVYYFKETPREDGTESELRALKGNAYHLLAPQFFEYCTKTQPEFKQLVSWEVIGHEKKVECDWGSVKGRGTLDLLVKLKWDNDLEETVVVDFKFYGNIPFKPYHDNVWQVAAYCEAVGADAFYVIYIDDIQRIKIFRFGYMTVADACEEYFLDVFKHVNEECLPERLPFGDKMCKMCPYSNLCWSELTEFMDSEAGEPVAMWEDLTPDQQSSILTFANLRRDISGREKEAAELRGTIINQMLAWKVKEVHWPTRSFKLRLIKSGKGYQLRILDYREGDEEDAEV